MGKRGCRGVSASGRRHRGLCRDHWLGRGQGPGETTVSFPLQEQQQHAVLRSDCGEHFLQRAGRRRVRLPSPSPARTKAQDVRADGNGDAGGPEGLAPEFTQRCIIIYLLDAPLWAPRGAGEAPAEPAPLQGPGHRHPDVCVGRMAQMAAQRGTSVTATQEGRVRWGC